MTTEALVVTHNDPVRLNACLWSIALQTRLPDSLLVVNSGAWMAEEIGGTLDMISDAGGLTEDHGPFALITRHGDAPGASATTIEIDLEALLYQGRTDLNPEILAGDLVHIPVDLPVRVYVNGAVGTPGEYETRASRPLTLLQAITKAGGLTARAARKKVEILRRTAGGGQETIPIDLKMVMRGQARDPVLQDGDVVVVRETYF